MGSIKKPLELKGNSPQEGVLGHISNIGIKITEKGADVPKELAPAFLENQAKKQEKKEEESKQNIREKINKM